MSLQDHPSERLETLLHALFDQGLDAEQGRELDELLRADPSARRTYLQFADLQANLERHLVARNSGWTGDDARRAQDHLLAQAEPTTAGGLTSSDAVMGVTFRLPESTDTASEQDSTAAGPSLAPPLHSGSPLARAWKRATAFRSSPMRWAALLALTLSLTAVIWSLSHRTPTAILVSAVDAQWDEVDAPLHPGDALPEGQLRIGSGIAQLKLAGGVTMIVEGPAQFEVNSRTSVSLDSGKLSAVVPHDIKGFTVKTASALIADLGTEFGVEAEPARTYVEVFQGSVRAESVSTETGTVQQQILTAGEAAEVTATTVTMDQAGASPQHFVRSLTASTAQLDVVDLICGGDGTTRRRGVDIDATGHAGAFVQVGAIKGDRLYHRIANVPVLDGCFIPDGRIGSVQIDSASHLFAFPATSDRSMENICTGGPIPAWGKRPGSSLLAEYATPEHSVLSMHANRGLTLDLAAIRRFHPGTALAGFRCLVGNILTSAPAHAKATLYVIVDGQPRLQKVFSNLDGLFPVEVALGAEDRFLTLAVTENGSGINELGTMFADASLETGGAR